MWIRLFIMFSFNSREFKEEVNNRKAETFPINSLSYTNFLFVLFFFLLLFQISPIILLIQLKHLSKYRYYISIARHPVMRWKWRLTKKSQRY